MPRFKHPAGGPTPVPAAPWLMGAMIGVTIMTMASTAMTLGAGLALTQASTSGPGK